jgi:two-component system, LytTR family, sensor kinase
MSELLNLVGLSTGVALYAMLLVMVVRRDTRSIAPREVDPLLLSTALLGLLWNLCALPAYGLPKLGVQTALVPLTVVGFGALGFLPAVVVQSVLRGDRDRLESRFGWSIAAAAFGVSATAAALHIRAAVFGLTVPSALGMQLLTYSYVVLAIPVAIVTRGQPGARRALWIAALSIFTVSALHLSQAHRDGPWPVELLGHHASIPLALAILYQDYPFALADLFLKRALTLLVLIAAAFLSVTAFHTSAVAGPVGGVREVGSLVMLWVATALLYPRLEAAIGWFVDTVVLRRPDYDTLVTQIAKQSRDEQDIRSLLDRACEALTPALSAHTVTWEEIPSDSAVSGVEPGRRSADVIIPATETPQYVLRVGILTGGRRLLSDDYAALQSIASILGRRIDAIRLGRERYTRQLREQEMSRLATEAELRALRSQINPHFLFNALTTIGYLIQTAPDRALETLLRLTSLLRGVLRSDGEFTTLGRELEVIESYLDIERARFEQRLSVRVDVPAAIRGVRIPPLLLQPLVENAVKHGIAPTRAGGDVAITARLDDTNDPPLLTVTVHDTGQGATNLEMKRGRAKGVGLANIERRLSAHYGGSASLSITTARGFGTTAEVRLPADAPATGGVASPPQERNVS